MSLATIATTAEQEENTGIDGAKFAGYNQISVRRRMPEARLRSVKEIFLEKVKSGSMDVLALGDALEFADNYALEQEKYPMIAEGFTNFMDQRRFDEAVYYFSRLNEHEKDFILNTRRYNYTINDMEFRRKYRLNGLKETRKEFVGRDRI